MKLNSEYLVYHTTHHNSGHYMIAEDRYACNAAQHNQINANLT